MAPKKLFCGNTHSLAQCRDNKYITLPTYLVSNFTCNDNNNNATQDDVVLKMGWEFCPGTVIVLTWVDLIHEHGSAYWFSILCVFVHSIIDVLNQLVANLDVFAADAWVQVPHTCKAPGTIWNNYHNDCGTMA